MFRGTRTYEVCLPDWSAVLPLVGDLIKVSDATGSFRAAESAFEDSNESSREWIVEGATGCSLSVKFEECEGYLFGVLTGGGSAFRAAAEVLWDAYIVQGGNPDAQELPR